MLRFFLPSLILIFSVLAKRLAGKSISDMTYLVSVIQESSRCWIAHCLISWSVQ